MIELKPCPFCGGKARLFVSNGVRVLCTKCGATTWTAADSERVGTSAVEDVIKAWNRWKKTTMVFKKDGKVYGSIESVVGEHCQKQRYCFNCVLYRRRGTKCCEEYANENPKEVAHLLDFEVIDDTPDIREVVEENSEDAKRKLTRADILHAAEKCVCGQRETDYGTPENNFKAIAELWEAYLNKACTRGVNVRVEAKDVAAMMALLKIARIAAGGGKADSWIDLAGYAACGAECEGVTE